METEIINRSELTSLLECWYSRQEIIKAKVKFGEECLLLSSESLKDRLDGLSVTECQLFSSHLGNSEIHRYAHGLCSWIGLGPAGSLLRRAR